MDATASKVIASPPEGGAAISRRLHPLSWAFVLVTQLKEVAFPLVILLVFGRGGWLEFTGVVAAILLAGYALVYSLTFRYWLGADELIVKKGLIGRTERHVPYARIQNVVQRRNILHRVFDVTELRLESASGGRPEAIMKVITVTEAQHIEAVLRGSVPSLPATADGATPPLLTMAPSDIVRLGLASNRGMVVVGGAVLLSLQTDLWREGPAAALIKALTATASDRLLHLAGPIAIVTTIGAAAAAGLVALKLLSVALAFLTFHGFVLRRQGSRVSTGTGLVTWNAATAQIDKIQRLIVEESWLARLMGRRALQCDIATGIQEVREGPGGQLRWLAPLSPTKVVGEVIESVVPGADVDQLPWRPLHSRAWRRQFTPVAVLATIAAGIAAYWIGVAAMAAWVGIVAGALLWARGWARFSAYAFDGEMLALRSGWLGRRWIIARVAKGQGVALSESPFDRRHAMANVSLDTAGAAYTGPQLEIPYLDADEARALAAALAGRIESSR